MKHIKTKSGFTLIEILVVIIVIGVLSGLSVPRFQSVIQRFQANEGDQTLYAVYQAQKQFLADTGDYAGQLTDLDIQTRASQYFNPPVAINPINPNAPTDDIASIDHQTLGYTLWIQANGDIHCTATVGGGFLLLCRKMGYTSP